MVEESVRADTVSSLFLALEKGDPDAPAALFAALYEELRRVARRELRRQGGALGTTTLLHETYLDMAHNRSSFPDRARFMAYASRVMRGLVIDHARQRRAQKRGGQFVITAIGSDAQDLVDERSLVEVGQALDTLYTVEPALARIVDLKFFCGFSFVEIAAMLDLSERTVQRHWEKARIYLYHSIRGNPAE
ncbi:MAG: ECF-type sigma factor [Bryobacteraceae bacterium]